MSGYQIRNEASGRWGCRKCKLSTTHSTFYTRSFITYFCPTVRAESAGLGFNVQGLGPGPRPKTLKGVASSYTSTYIDSRSGCGSEFCLTLQSPPGGQHNDGAQLPRTFHSSDMRVCISSLSSNASGCSRRAIIIACGPEHMGCQRRPITQILDPRPHSKP